MSFNRYGLHKAEQYNSFDLTRVVYKAFLAWELLEFFNFISQIFKFIAYHFPPFSNRNFLVNASVISSTRFAFSLFEFRVYLSPSGIGSSNSSTVSCLPSNQWSPSLSPIAMLGRTSGEELLVCSSPDISQNSNPSKKWSQCGASTVEGLWTKQGFSQQVTSTLPILIHSHPHTHVNLYITHYD